MAKPQQIIALGGGGFSMEPGNLALDRYVLTQADAACPRVCFIPTASGDNDNYIRRFYESYHRLDCRPRHLSLFRPPSEDLEAYIMENDVLYVGGGNTRNLLALWRDWGLDAVMRSAMQQGIVLAGISAGSVCWFEQGVTDSMTPAGSTELASIDGLGFLAGSNCPHYDGEANRRPEYHRLLREGKITNGWAADDGVALHYCNGSLSSIVSSRPRASAYRLEFAGGDVREERVEPRYLGDV